MNFKTFFLAHILAAAIASTGAMAANLRVVSGKEEDPTKPFEFIASHDQDGDARRLSPSGVISTGGPGATQYLQVIDSSGWVKTTSKLEDATHFKTYVYGDKTYYMPTDGEWKDDYYLSYNKNGYLAAFKWNNAVAWEQRNGCLTVDGTVWITFEYSDAYVVVDHTEHEHYEEICLNLG